MENHIDWQKLESISQEITMPCCEVNDLLPYSPWVLRAAVGGWYVIILLAIVRTYDSITSKPNVQDTHHLMLLTIVQWIQRLVVGIIMLYIQTCCSDKDKVGDKCVYDCSITQIPSYQPNTSPKEWINAPDKQPLAAYICWKGHKRVKNFVPNLNTNFPAKLLRVAKTPTINSGRTAW